MKKYYLKVVAEIVLPFSLALEEVNRSVLIDPLLGLVVVGCIFVPDRCTG